MSMKITNGPELNRKLNEFKVQVKGSAEQMVRRVAFAEDKAVAADGDDKA